MHAVDELEREGDEAQQGLERVGEDEPALPCAADYVAELADCEAAEQEACERDADVGGDEKVVVFGEEEGDCEKDGVAGLVGGEAVVVLQGLDG